jgi:DNA-cytosine methyltransferase
MERFNVLTLFDGCSMTYPALIRAGIPEKAIKYYAIEIDKFARQVGDKRVPNIIRPSDDVRLISGYNFPNVDLLIGGSPCQDLSIAGKGEGLKGSRSGLFWEWKRIRDEANPKWWILENVASMKSEDRDIISEALGVEPIRINSNLVSAQNRDRLYWTNIPNVQQPEDKGIRLEDVIESGEVDRDKSHAIDANYFKGTTAQYYLTKNKRQIVWKIPSATKKGYVEVKEGDFINLSYIRSDTKRGRLMIEKSNTVPATSHKMCKVTSDWFRKLTPLECERLQTLPEGWTDVGISTSQRYKVIGNGFTVDVIKHILSYIPEIQQLNDKQRENSTVERYA